MGNRQRRLQSRRRDAIANMTLFERYLSLWVALCIVVGIASGSGCPELSR